MAAPQPDGGAGAPPQADRDVDAYILARFPNPTNALFGALQLGDVAAVRRTLLRPGADAAQLFEVEMEGTTWPAEYDSGSEGEQGPPSSTILVSMLGGAAVGDCAAAVPLLLEAGAQVTLRDINQAIACGSVDVLAALLAAAQPRAPAGNGGLRWPEYDYACPLWSALWAAGTRGVCCSAAMAELLLAWYLTDKSAQECACDEVYTHRNFCPARVWGLGEAARFECLYLFGAPSDGRLTPLWELICAGPGPWSPLRHSSMPPAFKAAARALLLAAHRGGSSRGTEGGAITHNTAAHQHAAAALGALPPALLQHVLRLAAAPVTAWVALGE